MLDDYLFFGVDQRVFYSFRLLKMTSIANELMTMHSLSINKALLLSDAAVACVLLSSILDAEERINLRIQCDNDFTIGAEATAQAEVRAYLECDSQSKVIENMDLGLPQELNFTIRTLRSQRNRPGLSQGNTRLISSNIESALNDHLKNSYQMSTYLKINSWVDNNSNKLRAYGIIYQELPGIPAETSEMLNKFVYSLKDIKSIIEEDDDPDIIIKKIIPDQIRGVKSLNPKFVCECSSAKVEQVLCAFSKDELLEIIQQNEDVKIKCHYCSKNHVVDIKRVNEIFASIASQNDGKH